MKIYIVIKNVDRGGNVWDEEIVTAFADKKKAEAFIEKDPSSLAIFTITETNLVIDQWDI